VLLKIICLIFPAALINSCGNSGPSVKPKGVVADSLPKQSMHAPDTLGRGTVGIKEKTQKDSLLILSATGKPLIISGFLSKPGDVVTYSFKISNVTTKLKGKIKVDTKAANIRFNQIVTPNGQSAGPFGQEIEYTLTQKGTYKILIGQSLMAENAYVGPFLVFLTLNE
jgi:hypothetical protein